MTRYSAFGLLLAAGLPWVTMPTQAEEMSYAFVELNATIDAQYDVERRNIDEDGDGFGAAFSFIMGPIAYSEWSYHKYDIEEGNDGEEASIRVGVRKRMDRFRFGKLDLYAALSGNYANFERDTPATEFVDDTGLGAHIGLRHGPNRFFEYGLEAGYNNIENNHNDAAVHLQWNATHAIAFRLTYREANYQVQGPDVDLNTFKLSARLTFGGG